jgi:uncharacterized membrane protein
MMLVIGQLYLILLALVLAAAPQYYLYVFILYFVAIMGFSTIVSRRRFKTSIPIEEIERSRTLLKEDKAFEIAMEDEELLKLLGGQMRTLLLTLAFLPLYYVIFRFVRANHDMLAESIASLLGTSTTVGAFLVWLGAFEVMYVVSFASRRLLMRGQVSIPVVPRSFTVTQKGILIRGGMGQAISFPLEESTKVEYDDKRRYVEISTASGARIRLYTKNLKKLLEAIEKYGGVQPVKKEELHVK